MTEPSPTAAPSPDEVRAQLDRLTASQALAGSDQLKRLLRMIVERTLNGQSDLLKEYNLGLEVFQRAPDYDPKLDPIVRVQARRLRSKLDEYYAGEGSDDVVGVKIPKGAYIPAFESRVAAPVVETNVHQGSRHRRLWLAAAGLGILLGILAVARLPTANVPVSADQQRGIAVLPLRNYTGDANRSHIADQTTEIFTTELAKMKSLRVLSRTTASTYRDSTAALPQIAKSLGVRWVVEGGVGVGGNMVYVKLRAVDSLSDRKIWADVFDCEMKDMAERSARAAAAIAAAVETELRSPGR